MATIGQALTSPEAGWQRFDDIDTHFSYTGFTSSSYTGNYGGSYMQSNTSGSKVKFTFYGTKIRIIAPIGLSSSYSGNVSINIDGVTANFSETGIATTFQVLVYEKTGLSLGKHTVEITAIDNTYYSTFDAIDIDSTGYLVTPIGQALTVPESGWKRYDDGFSLITYTGTWTSGTETSNYNSTRHYSNTTNKYLKFKFVGSQLRIIGGAATNRSANITLSLDGTIYNFSEAYGTASITYQCLVFEKTGLINKEHYVEIYDTSANYLDIDAIDIDSTGRLLHPDEVYTPSELAIGKRIRCHYTALTSGAVGTFSALGQETYVDGKNDFIPAASSATPNGDFYYICVDYDYKGRAVVVADRNIQNSVSWDTLNTKGFATGSGLPYKLYQNIIPIMTANTSENGSTIGNFTTNPNYKAFDNDSTTVAGRNSTAGFLGFDFLTGKLVVQYSITSSSVATEYAPKAWTFQGSNDGLTWNTLDAQTNITFGTLETKSFTFSNSNSYSQYRLNITASNGTTLYIGTLKMMEQVYSKNVFSLRLLTGGILSTDTDNEWNNYIVNSTLDGTVTAGNNAVWNWSGISSWTSTVSASNSAHRVYEGGATASTHNRMASSTANTTTGFRPVLIVETLASIKYLCQDGNNIKAYNNQWQLIGTIPITEDMFKTSGMDALSSVTQVVSSGSKAMTSDGTVGVGKQFSCNLVSGMTSITTITTS